MLPHAFQTMTLQEPAWNMDTGASSHLAENTGMLTSFSNPSMYKSVFVGNGQPIPVTHTGHSLLHTLHKPLHLHHVLVTPNIIKNLIYVRQFTRDNNVSVDFDAYGFSVKDYQTRRLLLRCDSTGDLYPVTQQPSTTSTFALLTLSPTTWHRRLGHPSDDVLRRLESSHFISCNKSKLSALCHACQLGKHTKLPFYSSVSHVASVFDIVHSDFEDIPISRCQTATIRTVLSLAVSWIGPFSARWKNAFLHGQLAETFIAVPEIDLLLYVDDIVLTASSTTLLQRIITVLHGEFAMTDLGSLNYFLGISVQWSSSGLFLSQLVLQRKGSSVPDFPSPLDIYMPCKTGSVFICMTHQLPPHFTTLKRILRYVRGTLTFGLQIHASTTAQLTAYTDADWAGCPVTLSRSSAEVEYRGVANVVAETAWIRNLLLELHVPLTTATLVYFENVSVVYLTTNPVQHQRTKHIEIDIHFVRDYVASGQVCVLHIPSRFQYADIFTKGLPSALFCDFRSSLNVRISPVLTAGDY
ncbi:ribonuclease H-like domain-containing protein [Tanacetum coccineum]